MVTVKRKEGESVQKLLLRFSKSLQGSGVLRESRRSQFNNPKKSALERKRSAIHRVVLRKEVMRRKKLGLPVSDVKIKVKKRVRIQ